MGTTDDFARSSEPLILRLTLGFFEAFLPLIALVMELTHRQSIAPNSRQLKR
jgi:hypothetical protein